MDGVTVGDLTWVVVIVVYLLWLWAGVRGSRANRESPTGVNRRRETDRRKKP